MINRALRKLFRAESPPPMIWEPEIIGQLYPDRPYFLTQVRQGMAKLPLELQDKFSKAGHKVLLSRHIHQIAHLLPNSDQFLQETEGISVKEALLSIKPAHGRFFNHDQHVAIPQKLDNFSMTELLGIDISYITLHEIGHLFDHDGKDTPQYSTSEEFIELAVGELQQIPVEYLIKKTNNGANIVTAMADGDMLKAIGEVFSDLFAEISLGQSKMSALMPKTTKWIKQKIDDAVLDYRTNFILTMENDSQSPVTPA